MKAIGAILFVIGTAVGLATFGGAVGQKLEKPATMIALAMVAGGVVIFVFSPQKKPASRHQPIQRQADVVERMQQLAAERTIVHMMYKKPGEDWTTERWVEPYSRTYTNADALIILTWQVKPALDGEAWRNFRTDRILWVKNGGTKFTPRTRITLGTGEATPFKMSESPRAAPSKPSSVEQYTKFIQSALFDGRLTQDEIAEAQQISAGIPIDRLRAVHAQVFANMLGEMTMDGEISEHEEAQLKKARGQLKKLGWAP